MKSRVLAAFVMFGALAAVLATAGAAEEATPIGAQASLADMGYPEIVIEVDDSAIHTPGQITAGRTLITYKNTGTESRHSLLARLPDTLAISDIFIDHQSDAPPAWIFGSAYPGFPGEVLPGEQRQAVIDLSPGFYLVVDDFVAPMIVVPAEDNATPAAIPPVESVGTVRLFEFGFEFPAQVSPGRQVWEIVNAGRVPHELLLAKAPDGATAEQVLAVLTGEGDVGGLTEDSIAPVGGLGWLSPGATGWTEVELEAGTYVALCFVFDAETGMSHAMQGMVQVFEVARG